MIYIIYLNPIPNPELSSKKIVLKRKSNVQTGKFPLILNEK